MRADLIRYENLLCYLTDKTIQFVARNDVGTFDLLAIDRTSGLEELSLTVKRYQNESELSDVLPVGSGGLSKSGGRLPSKRTEQDLQQAASAKQASARVFNAYGIVGFVRFLHGYYVLVISEKSQVATIGHHAIYKIDRIETVYIPVPQSGVNDANEQRYLKTFQNVDLTSNFFMSYTYDLTRTLQSWIDGPTAVPFEHSFEPKFTWNSYLFSHPMASSLDEASSHRWILPIIHGYVGQGNVNIFGRHVFVTVIARRSRFFAGTRYLKRGISTEGYVANEVETEQIVFENPTLALVENPNKNGTDTASSPLLTDGYGLCSSFVQLRGSVPALWTQEMSSMQVGPPPISVFGYDLGSVLCSRHFNQLLKRYGAPIIVLDLVKTCQKGSKRNPPAPPVNTTKSNNNPHQQFVSPSEAQKEALLHEVLNESVNYLNQYMEPKFRIQYIHIDLAQIYRRDPTGAVTVRRLLEIGERVVASCGICTGFSGQRQKGAVRTNCVDCLDRTNTAQLSVGLVALGYQFYALGMTAQPVIELDSYCFRLFELLFEEMGDILALQYGGSLLVHHFATYRRAAPWISQSRDKLEQVARIVNNTFSDADRQHGKNLLLGIYRPYEHHRGSGTGLVPGQALWELTNDYDLHNPPLEAVISDAERRRSLVQWFDVRILKYLPMPAPIIDTIEITAKPSLKTTVDTFTTYFQPNRITFFEDLHEFKIPDTIKNLTPAGGILLPDGDLDPFIPRVRRVGTSSANTSNAGAGSLFRRFLQRDASTVPASGDSAGKFSAATPKTSIDGFDSSPLTAGPISDGESDDSAENYCPLVDSLNLSGNKSSSSLLRSPWPATSFSTVFRSQAQLYGCDFSSKSSSDAERKLFNSYCYMSEFKPVAGVSYRPITITPFDNAFRSDIDFLNVTVPPESAKIYEAYVRSTPGMMINGSYWAAEDRSDEYISYMQTIFKSY